MIVVLCCPQLSYNSDDLMIVVLNYSFFDILALRLHQQRSPVVFWAPMISATPNLRCLNFQAMGPISNGTKIEINRSWEPGKPH
jgi:hypothetical protein